MKITTFLRDEKSGEKLNDSKSHQQAFKRALDKDNKCILKALNVKKAYSLHNLSRKEFSP